MSNKQYKERKYVQMVEFIIDPEFRDKIPAMPQEDFEGLRADIIRDGYVRDPLVVWKEENILLDGHHRWRVISENREALGDKFQVDYKSFPDRWAAIAWICANQLHKHNMTPMQKEKLIQEEHDARQHSVGASDGFRGNQYTKVVSGEIHHLASENPKANKIRKEIAEEHNITENAVRTAVEVGRGIDRAETVVPGFKREVLSGETKANKQDLATIRNMKSDEDVKRAVDDIRKGKRIGNWANSETRNRYAKIRDIAEQMGTGQNGTTFDDVLRLLDAAESDYISKVERMIKSEIENLTSDDRWPNAIEGYFDSVISDINNLKGRIIK